jgi:site-specific DNA-cytosine methylase
MNVLSLFDGMSCGQIALERVGIKVDNYFVSEIDKYAIKVTQHNYPDTIQLGDVTKVKGSSLPKIDLLIGGSPCQGFSFAGKRLNFKDPRSKLFFEFTRLLQECKPKYFLLENVKMKREFKDVISKHLKVEPILIDSALITAAHRERLYWTNIPNMVELQDKKIVLKDILESKVDEKYNLSKKRINLVFNGIKYGVTNKICNLNGKSFTLSAAMGMGGGFKPKIKDGNRYRYLTPLECERLQTVPDNYTSVVSDTQRYKMLGNGWTVDVVANIFKGLLQ